MLRVRNGTFVWLIGLVALLGVLGAKTFAEPTQPSTLTLMVFKERRVLELRETGTGALIKTYKVGLGFAPVGHKEKQGDGKTPEGRYYVCVKNPKSKFYLSLGISYPSVADARTGLETGLITKAEYDRIAAAQAKGATPPWNTKLGGEVFIHGNGASSDWTWGCVALEDAEMKDLFNRVEIGTVIEIVK